VEALGKDQILAATRTARRVEAVDIAGLGRVHVREMTGLELDVYEAGNYERQADGRLVYQWAGRSAKLAAHTLCDASGKRLFTDLDARFLGDLPGTQLDAICRAARRVNGLTPADEPDAASAAKNLPAGQGDDSPSA